MGFELSLFEGGFNQALVQKQAVNAVMKYNDLTARYGLVLTEQQALALVKTRARTLQETGRIEFGGGIIDKLIFEFCDSPYLSQYHYEEELHELIRIFYYYKNETLDLMSDEDLIRYMKDSYDGVCHGSLEFLSGTQLDQLARSLRGGRAFDPAQDADEEDEDGAD